MTGDGGLVEVQATAERTPLSRAHLDDLLALAANGIAKLRAFQERPPGRRRSELTSGWADLRGRAGGALVLATRNEHKVREISRLLEPAGIVVRGASRRGASYLQRKARRSPTTRCRRRGPRRPRHGRPAIADDSGIEAEALGGAPGVRSARYAGVDASDEENLEKLIGEALPRARCDTSVRSRT